LGWHQLQKIAPAVIAGRTGAVWDEPTGLLTLPYLGRTCQLSLSQDNFPGADWLSLREKIVIVHYLIDSRSSRYQGQLISFKEMNAGNIYYPSFVDRVIKPLLTAFQAQPDVLQRKAFFWGGQKTNLAPSGIQISVLPAVKLFFLFYPADEEFPADLKVLFNGEIEKFLDTEDVVVLCEEIAARLLAEENSLSKPIT
ncbi:MAG TPA: DUF3786 domain-containing protein, partial [bacterium]|nr:DUF3786 domain-containing protein [bacterium]